MRRQLPAKSRPTTTLNRRPEADTLACEPTLVAGKLNKQTAAELGIVENTIKVHRSTMMKKMQAPTVADLVRLAVRAGITAAGGGRQ